VRGVLFQLNLDDFYSPLGVTQLLFIDRQLLILNRSEGTKKNLNAAVSGGSECARAVHP
jgi:hypothetical protein